MSRTTWYQWLTGKSRGRRRSQARRTGDWRHRPRIEDLETRTLPSVCSPNVPGQNWTSEFIARGSGDSATLEQQFESGHDYLFGRHEHDTLLQGSPTRTTITLAHTCASMPAYHPAVEGPIADINFGFDFRGGGGDPVQVGVLVRQGNDIYVGSGASFLSYNWQHQTLSNLSSASFARLDNPQAHPNFSATGAPLSFGMFTSTTATGPDLGPRFEWKCRPDPENRGHTLCDWYQVGYEWDAHNVVWSLTNFSVDVHPVAQPATKFVLTPSTTTPGAGVPFAVTVTALDGNNNRDYHYHGTVCFAVSPDRTATLPACYTFTTGPGGDNGSHVFSGFTLRQSGSQTITATDQRDNHIVGIVIVGVTPDVAVTLRANMPVIVNAGETNNLTVTAYDRFGNVASGYRGAVHFASSDPTASIVPNPYTYTAADAGVHTFSVTLHRVGPSGPQTITLADNSSPPLTASLTVLVNPGHATNLLLDAPTTVLAGVAFNMGVAAYDQWTNPATSYRATVRFTSSDHDPQVTLPSPYTFQQYDGDAGAHHNFNGLTLRTPGPQTVTVTDDSHPALSTTVTITVTLPVASTLQVLCNPMTVTAGTSIVCTATAQDRQGHTATGYIGTVRFTSSDGQATLPPDYRFQSSDNGVHPFIVTLKTAGPQTVTVADTVNFSITGSANVTVNPAAASVLTFSLPTTVSANLSFRVPITARDAYGNQVTGYRGTLHFTSTDLLALLPPDNQNTFTAADNGTHTFTITFRTAGSLTLTATDTMTSSITGTAATTVPGLFRPATNYTVGTSPLAVAAGDFNGDGIPDLATVNSGSDTVSVLLGNGDGTFQAAVNYPAGHLPRAVVVGDFNGDGLLDLAVANASGISILLGNGDGTFQVPLNYAVSGTPAFLATGDFNGDGFLDLAVASDTGVSVLLGNGDSTFQNPVTYSLGFNATARSLVVSDFNGDNQPDLAVAYAISLGSVQYGAVAVLVGNGDGTFRSSGAYSLPGIPDSVVLGDLNGDSILDLVVTTNDTTVSPVHGAVSVLLGNGDGTFQDAQSFDVGVAAYGVAVGDVDGDGVPDLAVASGSGVMVLAGNGDGTFQLGVNYRAGSSPRAVALADLNGDDAIDLAVASSDSNDISVLLNAMAAPSVLRRGDGSRFAPVVRHRPSDPVFAQALALATSGDIPEAVFAIRNTIPLAGTQRSESTNFFDRSSFPFLGEDRTTAGRPASLTDRSTAILARQTSDGGRREQPFAEAIDEDWDRWFAPGLWLD